MLAATSRCVHLSSEARRSGVKLSGRHGSRPASGAFQCSSNSIAARRAARLPSRKAFSTTGRATPG